MVLRTGRRPGTMGYIDYSMIELYSYNYTMKDIYEIKIIHMEPIQWVKRGVEGQYLGK